MFEVSRDGLKQNFHTDHIPARVEHRVGLAAARSFAVEAFPIGDRKFHRCGALLLPVGSHGRVGRGEDDNLLAGIRVRLEAVVVITLVAIDIVRLGILIAFPWLVLFLPNTMN